MLNELWFVGLKDTGLLNATKSFMFSRAARTLARSVPPMRMASNIILAPSYDSEALTVGALPYFWVKALIKALSLGSDELGKKSVHRYAPSTRIAAEGDQRIRVIHAAAADGLGHAHFPGLPHEQGGIVVISAEIHEIGFCGRHGGERGFEIDVMPRRVALVIHDIGVKDAEVLHQELVVGLSPVVVAVQDGDVFLAEPVHEQFGHHLPLFLLAVSGAEDVRVIRQLDESRVGRRGSKDGDLSLLVDRDAGRRSP